MISQQQFLVRQPGNPPMNAELKFYYDLANDFASLFRHNTRLSESLCDRIALILIGYYEDIVTDAGLWRGFVNECRRLFGFSVPFHTVGESYVDYEINIEDVRFLIWYAAAMSDESLRDLYPHTQWVMELSERVFRIMSENYDDAPIVEGYNMTHEMDMFDPEDSDQIMHFGNWMFLHSWLLTPAFSLTLSEILTAIPKEELAEHPEKVREILETAMAEEPTGPLALYLREWLFLTISDKMPPARKTNAAQSQEHKYYKAVTEATGKTLLYIKTYGELNSFFINVLGWSEGEMHLSQFAEARYFAVMVNPEKGLLVAPDVARNIADPQNPYYDKDFAATHAFDLLTQRGRCPGDLLRLLIDNDWLPDARFPETSDTELVKANAAFIGRCYLQKFWRGD